MGEYYPNDAKLDSVILENDEVRIRYRQPVYVEKEVVHGVMKTFYTELNPDEYIITELTYKIVDGRLQLYAEEVGKEVTKTSKTIHWSDPTVVG